MTSAENIEAMTPMARVTPKPLTGPEPRKKSSPAARSVVMFESATALNAFWKPVVSAERRERVGWA